MEKQLSLGDFPPQVLNSTLETFQQRAQQQRQQNIVLECGKKLHVWRLDEVCPFASGNKLFKQALYWQYADLQKQLPLLSFGGAYSNHLYALAAEAQRRKRQFIAIVRGLHSGELNPCLKDMQDMGAHIEFVSRKDYKQKSELHYLKSLKEQHGSFVHIPEGGGGLLGAFGAQAIGLAAAESSAKTIVLAAGTGSTAAGVLAGLDLASKRRLKHGEEPKAKRVLVVPVINLHQNSDELSIIEGIRFLRRSLAQFNDKNEGFCSKSSNDKWVSWDCIDGFQFGGYAKFPEKLAEFVRDFEMRNSIPLDPVYTAKAMAFAHCYLSNKNIFELSESRPSLENDDREILFIHSGGLQGRRGFNLL